MFKPTLNETYIHVFSRDPAIDRERRREGVDPPPDAAEDWRPPPAFDHEAFIRTGDQQYLPLVPEIEPRKFYLGHLRGEQIATARGWLRRVVARELEPETVYHRIAAMCLKRWEGVYKKAEGGDVVEVEIDHYLSSDGLPRVTAELMTMLEQERGLVSELGQRVVMEDLVADPT
jgi:hypothetical protein